jgi:3-deoxy-manno-octulosonate cytidylyltransferase (CMP-KDO synthetase)
MRFFGIIPARYASTRFPGKPLAMINGISMVMRVYGQVMKAEGLDEVFVATDDKRIYEHVLQEGGQAIMTSSEHPSGTDRVHEAMNMIMDEQEKRQDVVVINIQGDEPFVDPDVITRLSACFKNPGIGIATLMKKIQDKEELSNPNIVKVISGKSKQALYFSRSPLPFIRGADPSAWMSSYSFFKHIGIYAYRGNILKDIAALEPSALEKAEGLEQLRWLENGYNIHLEETDYEGIAVDTPADLSKIMNKS